MRQVPVSVAAARSAPQETLLPARPTPPHGLVVSGLRDGIKLHTPRAPAECAKQDAARSAGLVFRLSWCSAPVS